MQFAQAIDNGGTFTLDPNPVWNVPPGGDVYFDFVMDPPTGPACRVVAVKALVFDYKSHRIFGVRKAREIYQDGQNLRGRVSLGNKKHACYTGKRTFRRPDGTLCDVSVLFVDLP